MGQLIGKCGYRCDLCPACLPNIKSDADKQRMCDALAKYFGLEMSPEEFSGCGGCVKEGGDPNCGVRPCAIEKGVENCAHCEEFACDKITAGMSYVEQKVKDLSSVPEEDYNLFIKPFLSRDYLQKIRESLEN